jgi:hypothetical protein
MLCPYILKDYGPTLKMPALQSGTYQIFAVSKPYCEPNTICPLIKMAPQLSGALTVTGGSTVLKGKEKSLPKRERSYKGGWRIDAIHNALGRNKSGLK